MEKSVTILCNTSSFNYNEFPDSIKLIKNSTRKRLTEEEVEELVKKHDPVGIIAGIEPITEKVLMAAKSLKAISRCGVDIEMIDQKAAKKLGITVTHSQHSPYVPVSELTVTMILSLLRQMSVLDDMVRNKVWNRKVTGLLQGKLVGVIGCESLGTRVCSILSGFECGLLGYDPGVKTHHICEMVSLDFLLRHADIITLNVPMREEYYHMIGEEEIAIMKDGVIIVNTSRPGLIDENALVAGLESKKIGGVGLDVYEEEPYEGPLLGFKANTILTPHVGSFAGTYRFDIEKDTMENLLTALNKQGIEV